MFCGNCGNQFQGGGAFCPHCGAPVQAAPVCAPAAPMNKKEFWNSLGKKERSNIMSAAIMCYISAGLTMILGLIGGDYLVVIEVLLLAGLGLWLQLSKSTVAAWFITVYAAINTTIMLVTTGTPGGYLVLIAGVCAIIGCRKFNKAYKAQLK